MHAVNYACVGLALWLFCMYAHLIDNEYHYHKNLCRYKKPQSRTELCFSVFELVQVHANHV